MEILNQSGLQAGYTQGLKPDGREMLVVAIKGTYSIPKNGEQPQLADEQIPIIEADVFTGEPGFSSPLYESDYPSFKPKCDVLLNGSAYAPYGRPAERVQVSLQIGSISKSFSVAGHRVWQKNFLGFGSSSTVPFTKKSFSYDNAFGGVDNTHENPEKHEAYLTNPVGIGFHCNLEKELVEGKPLPNTEELNNPMNNPKGKYRPMAFGPIGRGWQPRMPLAGTYDQNWLDNIFPFLPPDFQDEYYQSAPSDQQMPYPKGGEKVLLTNLTPEGRTIFSFPDLTMPVTFYFKNGEKKETNGVVDTIMIRPDESQFMLTWRSSILLRKNMFEVIQVLVGRMSRGWHRARQMGKTYYSSMGEMAKMKKIEEEEFE